MKRKTLPLATISLEFDAMADETSLRRKRSREVLLNAMRGKAGLTRDQLASETGLSRSATAAGVSDLLDSGLISERRDTSVGGSGRPGRTPSHFVVVRRAGIVVGIDFGHTHVRVATADTNGDVLGVADRHVDLDIGAHDAMSVADDLISGLLDDAGIERRHVLATAAGIPGPLDRRQGRDLSPSGSRPWRNLPAAQILSDRLGMTVLTENDANLGALGEMHLGAGRGYRDFLYIKASHGIGAGLVLDGRVYHGFSGIAGEIGHTPLPGENHRCRCGNLGCLESVTSLTQVQEHLEHTQVGSADLDQAALDPVGMRVLADAGRMIGRIVADACNWLNPQAIVLGGELGSTGQAFQAGFSESLARFGQPAVVADVAVRTAALGTDSEVRGALVLASESAARSTERASG